MTGVFKHSGDVRPGRIPHPNYDDSRHVSTNCLQFSLSKLNVLVLGNRQPAPPPDKRDPGLVRLIRPEMIVMNLNLDSRLAKVIRDDLSSEAPVKEEGRLRPLPGARTGSLLRFPRSCTHSRSPDREWTRPPCSARR